MNDLEVAFDIAVRTIGQAQVHAVDARLLHARLGNGDEFAHWIRDRIEQYGFVEDQDFVSFWEDSQKPRGGRRRREYAITLDMAKELAMVERTMLGRVIRRYFIDCERRFLETQVKEAAVGILLLPAPREWKRRFEPPYYEALAKMTGTTYDGHANGTPPVFGLITDQWVYQIVMPADVLAEMRSRCSEAQKLHQWLTDGGLEKVERQILRVIDQAKSSADYQDFKARCMRVFEKPGQLGIIYPIAA